MNQAGPAAESNAGAPGRHRLVAAQPRAGFFEADVVTLQKTPERAAAARYSLLVQGRDELFERPVRPLADQREDPVRVVLQRRSAAAAWPRRTTPFPPPRLKPFDRRAGTDFKTLRRLTPRCSPFNRFDHTLAQIQ